MNLKTIVEVSAAEAAMLTQLRANSELAQRPAGVAGRARADQLSTARADEAEERIVTQLRALGTVAMHSWARQSDGRLEGGRAGPSARSSTRKLACSRPTTRS